jgi:hypothetical protein
MHVFLDSNIFFNHWYLESSQLRLLLHYLNNEGYTLLVSNLVVEEVENKHRSLARGAYSTMEKEANTISALFPKNKVNLPPLSDMPVYNLERQLKDRVDFISKIGYENIPQSVVVQRAMSSRRPFQANEKGYRDTLIWLSLLQHLKEEEIDGDVAFITTNINDFMGADKSSFHPDLLDDIPSAGLQCRMHSFSSLSSFLSQNVNSEDHLIDRTRAESLVEDYLEDGGVAFLETMSQSQILKLEMHLFGVDNVLANSSSISARIVEGMEDLDFDKTIDVGDNDVFIASSYNLRVVQLDVDIPLRDYEINKGAIDRSSAIYDVDFGGGIVTLRALVRPVYEVGFIFNVVTEECEGYSVDSISFYEEKRQRKGS